MRLRQIEQAAGLKAGRSESRRQRQIAFEHDALVLFVDALDLIARIARVAIGLRQQPADLELPGGCCAKNSWNKIDRLPDREFVRHKMSFPILNPD